MTENRNIAQLARNSYFNLLGHVNETVIAAIPELYDSVRPIDTKKGTWRIYKRRDLPHFLEEEKGSDGFCAVYEKNGEPRTLFLGKLEDVEYVDFTANELSRGVLEQRRWFARPPKQLTAINGTHYGTKKASAVLVLAMIPIAADIGITIYNKLTGNFAYDSVVESISDYYFSQGYNPIFTIGGPLSLVSGSLLGSGLVGGRLGKVADRIRIKNLPERAFSFLYGPEAEQAILKDHATMREEIRNIQLHEELRRNGIDISKTFFLLLDKAMRASQGDVAAVLTHLKQNPNDLGIPLERLVKVYSSAG